MSQDTNVSVSTSSSQDITASGAKIIWIFKVPKDGTLEQIEFPTQTISLNSASVIRVSFQDPASSYPGYPDGTQDQYRDIPATSLSSLTWTAPGIMSSDGTDSGTKRTVSQGDTLCAVIEYQTFNTSDAFRTVVMEWPRTHIPGAYGFPFCTTYNGSSYSGLEAFPPVALKYDDGSYEQLSPNAVPCFSDTVSGIGVDSDPDEVGFVFKVPINMNCEGFFAAVGPINLGSFDACLYKGSTLQTSLPMTYYYCNAGYNMLFIFPSTVELVANAAYRCTIKPTNTYGVSVSNFNFPSEAIKNAAYGPDWKYTYRTDGGSWTDDGTKMIRMAGIQVGGVADALTEAALKQPNLFVVT